MEHRPLVLIDGVLSQLPTGDTITGAIGGTTSEEEMAYAKRTDVVGEVVIYKGEASPGTSETAAFWRIHRLTINGDDVSEEWADGDSSFNNVWADRLTLTYL